MSDLDYQALCRDLTACLEKRNAGLENCRLYASRHRRQPWAQEILRLCAAAGIKGSPLRDSIAPSTEGR